MRTYYRKRLILVAMMAFLILMILVISGVSLFSYFQMERETNRTVQFLLSPPGEGDAPAGGIWLPAAGRLTPMQNMPPSPFYDIVAQADGSVVTNVARGFLEYDDEDIQDCVSRIVLSGQASGRLDSFKYGVRETDGGEKHIILMDTTIQTQLLLSVLRNALLIGALLMILLLVILLPLTAKAAAMLAQNTEKQKRFVTDAGHELKTPVAVIRSNLDVMELLQGKSNWSGNIRTQVDRLEGLVKQLLLTARVDEKQWTGKTAVIDFAQDMRNELSIYDETVLQKDLKLENDIEAGLYIRGDEESARQLIHALLDNAMQYTPAGGSVWVKAGREKNMLRLEILNTVDALPQIEPERLLDRFTRGDDARSRKNGGTGIGLSTAKSIVELYRGSIAVSYASNCLFQVIVRLPLASVSSRPETADHSRKKE